MIPKCIPILGITLMWKLRMFKALVEKGKQAPPKHHYKGLEA
jgi:hypothetical protein